MTNQNLFNLLMNRQDTNTTAGIVINKTRVTTGQTKTTKDDKITNQIKIISGP